MWHCSQYKQGYRGKRNNNHCCFRTTSGVIGFGRLVLFVKTPIACAYIREFQPTTISLMGKVAGEFFSSIKMQICQVPMLFQLTCQLLIMVHLQLSQLFINCVLYPLMIVIQPNNVERVCSIHCQIYAIFMLIDIFIYCFAGDCQNSCSSLAR